MEVYYKGNRPTREELIEKLDKAIASGRTAKTRTFGAEIHRYLDAAQRDGYMLTKAALSCVRILTVTPQGERSVLIGERQVDRAWRVLSNYAIV